MVDEGAFDKADGHPTVVAYRMGKLETVVDGLDTRVDRLPSTDTINLMLEPWKQTVRDLQAERKSEIQLKSQLKVAIAAAIISPVMAVFISIFVTYGVNK